MSGPLCIIPAKGYSRRFPRKNVALLGGRPLLTYSVDVALQSGLFEKVLVTTEDAEIASIARDCGAEVDARPVEMASDSARLTHVCLDLLERLRATGRQYDTLCLLQPTCPLRTVEDLTESHQLLDARRANFVVSVTEYEEPPFWSLYQDGDGYLKVLWGDSFLTTRGSLPEVCKHSGSIVWARTEAFIREKEFLGGSRSVAYHMPKERSVDIDHPLDLKLAEILIHEGSKLEVIQDR